MMNLMRVITKPIFWLVIIAFVGLMVFQWGMGGGLAKSNKMGEIYGKPVSPKDLDTEYKRRADGLKTQNVELTQDRLDSLQEAVWNAIVEQKILDHAYDSKDIKVSNSELVNFIKTNPLPEVQNIPAFQTEKQFDRNKYLQVLESPDPKYREFYVAIEDQSTQYVRFNLLQAQVSALTLVTDAEAMDIAKDQQEQIQVRYAFADAGNVDISSVKPADAELQKYFADHKETFKLKESVNLSFVRFPLEPTEIDRRNAHDEANDAIERVKSGDPFEDMNPEGKEKVDLGWITKGIMAPIDSVAFLLDSGKVSEPFIDRIGSSWLVVRVMGKKIHKARGKNPPMDSVLVQQLAFRVRVGDETRENVESKALALMGAGEEAKSLGKAASTFKGAESLQVVETGFFERKNPVIPYIGNVPSIWTFAWSAKPGEFSEVITTSTAVYVMQALEHRESGYPQFSAVRDRVTKLYLDDYRKNACRDKIAEVEAAVKSGMNLKDAAAKSGVIFDTTGTFTRMGGVPRFGMDPLFSGTAFSLSQQRPISKPTIIGNGAVLVEMLGRVPYDDQRFAQEKRRYIGQVMQQNRNAIFGQWIAAAREEANIKDLRKEFRSARGGQSSAPLDY